jgi:hypothetical protein
MVTRKPAMVVRETNGKAMKFDVYGRFFVEVIRDSGRWIVYRIDRGRRLREDDLVIPGDTRADDIPSALEDLLHENAAPDRKIKLIE